MNLDLRQLTRRLDSHSLAQAAVLVAAVAQLPTAALGSRSRGDRPSVEQLSNSFDIPTVPANGTFAVWGPLYLGSLALAGYQALPSRRGDPLLRRIRLPFALACAGNAVWVPLFTSRRYTAALGAILTTLAGSTLAYARVSSAPALTRTEAWLVRAPAGALSGWISVATPSAFTTTLLAAGGRNLSRGHSRVPRWPVPVLAAVTGVAAVVTRRLPGSLSYPATVVWGLAGVAANRRATPAVRAAAAGSAVLLATTALAGRPRR